MRWSMLQCSIMSKPCHTAKQEEGTFMQTSVTTNLISVFRMLVVHEEVHG